MCKRTEPRPLCGAFLVSVSFAQTTKPKQIEDAVGPSHATVVALHDIRTVRETIDLALCVRMLCQKYNPTRQSSPQSYYFASDGDVVRGAPVRD